MPVDIRVTWLCDFEGEGRGGQAEFQKDEALATNTGFIPPLLSNALSSLLPSHCGLHAHFSNLVHYSS